VPALEGPIGWSRAASTASSFTFLQRLAAVRFGTQSASGAFYDDRDAARTLDRLRIRQYLASTSLESENRGFAGASKRLKGLEPSTFCMASRPKSRGFRALCLQINRFHASTM